jgi:hypothetical protein
LPPSAESKPRVLSEHSNALASALAQALVADRDRNCRDFCHGDRK